MTITALIKRLSLKELRVGLRATRLQGGLGKSAPVLTRKIWAYPPLRLLKAFARILNPPGAPAPDTPRFDLFLEV